MKNVLISLVLFSAWSPTAKGQPVGACPEGAFLAHDGLVVIEAEGVPLSTGWVLEHEVAGYSGAGYITWTHATTTQANGQGVLRYPFTIREAGTYTVKLRNYHPCEDVTECNDVFVRMDDGAWRKNFNHTLRAWDWNSRQDIDHVFSEARYELTEGQHTLYLSGRSCRC